MIDAQRVVVNRPPTQVALAWLLAQGEKWLRQARAGGRDLRVPPAANLVDAARANPGQATRRKPWLKAS